MRRFAPEEIAEVWQRLRAGQSVRSVAIGLGRHPSAVRQLIKRSGGVPPLVVKSRGPRFLSIWKREEISRALLMGASIRSIAAQLGRSPSTISREIRRNTFVGEYPPLHAEKSVALRAGRPKPAKLAITPALRAVVEEKLELCWSPQQISAWLRIHYPDDKEMHVSNGTNYMSLFVQGRGALRRELHRNLRTHRALRRRQSPQPFAGQGYIPNMVNISASPLIVEFKYIFAIPEVLGNEAVMKTQTVYCANIYRKGLTFRFPVKRNLMQLPKNSSIALDKHLVG